MAVAFKRYPPVASALPRREVIAAWRSHESVADALQKIAEYLRIPYLFPVNCGRAALYAVLKAAFAPGAKIILPGYTCFTVAAAVVRAGMTPILSDSCPTDLGYDLNALQKTLRQHPETRAIVVCHLLGIALDVDEIRKMAGGEILVIDDAAQGFGITARGNLLGTSGHAGFFSFGRGKNLSLVGGGLLVTDNNSLGDRIQTLYDREFAAAQPTKKELFAALAYGAVTHPILFNIASRLPGITLGRSMYDPDFALYQASDFKMRLLGRIYHQIENENKRRRQIADTYTSLLSGNARICIPRSRIDNSPGTLRFPILVDDTARRDEILHSGAARNWGLSGMYPTPLNGIPSLPQLSEYQLAGAELIARSLVTLPTHRHISLDKTGLIGKIARMF